MWQLNSQVKGIKILSHYIKKWTLNKKRKTRMRNGIERGRGSVNGAAFSAVLRLAQGHRTFDEMSLWRFAGLGALGGLVVSLIVGSAAFLVAFTVLGAGSAAGSLAVARMADPSLESGEGLGLLEEETPDPSA